MTNYKGSWQYAKASYLIDYNSIPNKQSIVFAFTIVSTLINQPWKPCIYIENHTYWQKVDNLISLQQQTVVLTVPFFQN